MDDSSHRAAAPGAPGINLIDFLIVFAERKKLIVCLPLAVAVLAAGLSFLIPNEYKATTKILPPQQSQSSTAALLSQLGGVPGGASLPGMKNPNDIYLGMLRSRTIADALIKRFDLKRVYDKELDETTRKKLEENTGVVSAKDGMIVIDVEDQDRQRATDLSNAYVEELMKLTKVLAVTEASQRRLFFERQLDMVKNNLATAEVTLKKTLGTRGVISVDSESQAIVETVAALRAQIAAKQIQLSALAAFVTDNNQQYKRVAEELASMRSELSKLENGRPDGAAAPRPGDTQAGLENIKLLRELKYHQMLYELLAKHYEAARLDEARDASLIQVLDKAILPERKSKPARLLLTLAAGVLTLFGVLAWLLLADAKRRLLRDPGNAQRAARLRSAMRASKAV